MGDVQGLVEAASNSLASASSSVGQAVVKYRGNGDQFTSAGDVEDLVRSEQEHREHSLQSLQADFDKHSSTQNKLSFLRQAERNNLSIIGSNRSLETALVGIRGTPSFVLWYIDSLRSTRHASWTSNWQIF